jgi:nucleoside-triphosphatase THEP1
MFKIEVATKEKCKLRLAIMGVSGSGKTYSALRIAKGIAGEDASKILFVDTERRSARKYSDRFKFSVIDLDKPNIDSLIELLEFVNNQNFEVLIIDSLTHAWQELLEEIDKLAKAKFGGNSFQAWAEGTPKQKRFIQAILDSKCHVVCTMRSKTEWVVAPNARGKMTPTRVGTGVEQGKGIEYEFDMLIDISQEHIAQVLKDRTGKFQDKLIEKPDEKFGKALSDWLDEGAEPETKYEEIKIEKEIPEVVDEFIPTSEVNRLKKLGADKKLFNGHLENWVKKHFGCAIKEIKLSQLSYVIGGLERYDKDLQEEYEKGLQEHKIESSLNLRHQKIGEEQVRKFFTILQDTSLPLPRWSIVQAKEILKAKWGIATTKDITVDQFDDVCEYFLKNVPVVAILEPEEEEFNPND